ncbi:SDR family NAD(P)-dependent oxidoreductase [Candidatus Woesearchaeota archaeon]|nr:SDR family NAD(P)-dependent oxidoreductase [Candidatus Woesearchaeota archaeon]
MKKAVVIGATSGMGRELAKILAKNNYIVGLAGRRANLLSELQNEIPTETHAKRIDVSKTKEAMALLNELIKEMDGMDLIVINSAVSYQNPELEWDNENETINVNIRGFAAMANVAVKYFSKKGYGHIVGISSIAALRHSCRSTAYGASKAFVSHYMRGLRQKLVNKKLKIYITEIVPGLVDTPMIKNRKGLFWVASAKKAAGQIFEAIKKKKKKVYITKRWTLIALLLKMMPEFVKRML